MALSCASCGGAPAPEPPRRDISGVWAGPPLPTLQEPAPFTPAGQVRYDANKPTWGPKAVGLAESNDPLITCDPLGFPRSMLYETRGFEFVHTPTRTIQLLQYQRAWREIWTDGRPLPVDPEPRWMGYSVGRWEGDEFVVQSLGFDERTWLDHFGNPISEEARFEERYRRVDRDTLELRMTLTDAKAYTRPWVSETKVFRLDPKREIEELFCVPSENDDFNRRVRDPGAGVTR